MTEDGRQHQQQLQQRRVMMYQHGTRYQTPDMSWGDKRYFKAYRRSYSRHGSNPKLGSAHYYCVLLLVPHGWYSVAALQRTSRPRPSTGEKANQVTLCYMLDVSDLIYADIVLSSGIA